MGCGSSSSTDSSQPSSKPGLLFSWPKAGNILLKTVKFRAEYDPRSKELVIRLSDKTVTESRLIWNGDKFELEDIRKVDTISGKAEPVTGLKLQFIVSPEGRFRDMLSTQKLLEQLAIAQKVNLSLNQIHKATNKLVKEVKNQWGRWVEAWLSPTPPLALCRAVKNPASSYFPPQTIERTFPPSSQPNTVQMYRT